MYITKTLPLETVDRSDFYLNLYEQIKNNIRASSELEYASHEESMAIIKGFNSEIASHPHKYQDYWNNKYCFDVDQDSSSPLLKFSSWALVSNGLTGHFEINTFNGLNTLETLDLYEIKVTHADLKECITGFHVCQRVLVEICELYNLPTGLNFARKGRFSDRELEIHQKLVEFTGMKI